MSQRFPHADDAAESARSRTDVAAALAARAELGPAYEDAIAAGLAERVEQLVALRTAELRQQTELSREAAADARSARTQRFVIGLVSLGTGIPVTAIAANLVEPSLLGVAVSWAGIVAVNAVHALGQRRNR